MIPFLDIGRLHSTIRAELDDAVASVIDTSAFVGAGGSRSFEDAFGQAHGYDTSVACGSGTDALALSLRALGLDPGSEVIVPSMTFVATLEAVVHAGLTPVIADVDPGTLLLDQRTVAAARSPRTRVVIPVHLYGHVVPFGAIREWRASGLFVIEDAAQAHLASWQGAPVGTAGTAACFSFYPGKNLGAFGDGGAVVSHDQSLLDAVRRLRDHGRTSKYTHDVIGFCSRLDGIQAAVLEVKLAHLKSWNGSRTGLAERYRHHLGAMLVPWEEGAVHHLLVARVPADARAELQGAMRTAGIETGIHYPVPLSKQPSCQPWARRCPAAEAAASSVLSLPMDPLMSVSEVDAICRTVLEFFERGSGKI